MDLGILRLIAALAVLLSHCFALTKNDAGDPLVLLTGGHASLGEGAVYVFFALSGYLITQSWMRDPSLPRFMLRRSLRIFPALVFVILCSVLIIGPLMTNLSIADYFGNWETWTYLSKIFIYPTQYGLPGVFESNPFPGVVNGSLWSLRLEFALYIMVAVMGLSGLLRWRMAGVAGAVACAVMSAVLIFVLPRMTHSYELIVLFLNATPFFAGLALAQNKKMAARPPAKEFNDYSYGVYVWAFPVQQMVIALMPGIGPMRLLLVSLPPVLAMAAISWHLIESRVLKFKPRSKKAS